MLLSNPYRSVLTGSLLAAALLAAPAASAEDQGEAACLSDHEHSQVLRMDGKLMETRAALRRCSASACPSVVRSDCTQWLAEVSQMIPSIVLSVSSDKGEERNVNVDLDGKPLTDTITGKPIELDPGAHDLKFELQGWPAQTQHVVIREGERNRIVEARFEKAKPPPPPTQGGGLGGPVEPTGPRPVPAATYVFGVLALGSAGMGTYFGITTKQKFNEAKSGSSACAPNCPASRTDPIRLRAILADSSFGAAVLCTGIAGYFFFTRPVVPDDPKKDSGPKKQKKAEFVPRVDFGVSPRAGMLQITGEF